MRTSFHHQSEAQPPNGPLTAATSPDTPSTTSEPRWDAMPGGVFLWVPALSSQETACE